MAVSETGSTLQIADAVAARKPRPADFIRLWRTRSEAASPAMRERGGARRIDLKTVRSAAAPLEVVEDAERYVKDIALEMRGSAIGAQLATIFRDDAAIDYGSIAHSRKAGIRQKVRRRARSS